MQQCKFLEGVYHSNVSESILQGEDTCLEFIDKALRAADSDYVWSKVAQQTSLSCSVVTDGSDVEAKGLCTVIGEDTCGKLLKGCSVQVHSMYCDILF